MAAEGKSGVGKGAKAPAAPAKRSREIKDAGQRTVFRGLVIDGLPIVKQLAKDRGLTVKNLEEAKADKGLAAVVAQLGLDEDGNVLTWVRIGQVKAETREDAVDAVVGTKEPGQFRAPTASAWRGRVIRNIPAEIPLDVEVADD